MKAHPYTTSYNDRHGRRRWRFRKAGRARELPECPGNPDFEAAYQAALNDFPAPKRRPLAVSDPIKARTLRAAFVGLQKSVGWKSMKPNSQRDQRRVAERLLASRVFERDRLTWADVPFHELKRDLVGHALNQRSATPHAAAHVLRMFRKLITYGLDHVWITEDPTYRLSYRPKSGEHRAWTPEERQKFLSHWPEGSTPRLAYTLPLWTGSRRSDLVRLRWDWICDGTISYEQQKTGTRVAIPIMGQLRRELEAAQRRGNTILLTQHGQPFSAKSLTGRFRDWANNAGLAGCTLHGLRKNLGAALADSGATETEIQSVLGHKTLQQATLYTKAANRQRNAASGMSKLSNFR